MNTQAHAKHPTPRVYALVLLALLLLTAMTVSASGVDFGSPGVNVVIALLIASLKACLVALFFMHLRYDKPINAVIFSTGLVFLALFLIFCLIDFESREAVVPENLKIPGAVVAGGEAAAK